MLPVACSGPRLPALSGPGLMVLVLDCPLGSLLPPLVWGPPPALVLGCLPWPWIDFPGPGLPPGPRVLTPRPWIDFPDPGLPPGSRVPTLALDDSGPRLPALALGVLPWS
jgi:hypothetical protein